MTMVTWVLTKEISFSLLLLIGMSSASGGFGGMDNMGSMGGFGGRDMAPVGRMGGKSVLPSVGQKSGFLVCYW